MVVLNVPARGLEVAIALLARRLVGFVEDVELQLRADLADVAERPRPRHLALEDAARRVAQVGAVMIDAVGDHQRRALEPGNPPQGREVRLQREIAVARIPGGDPVPRDRLHVHVDREQVVADMHLVDAFIEEEAAGHPLAEEAALHVGKADQHGVDLALLDIGLELREVEVSGHDASAGRNGLPDFRGARPT